MDCVAMTTRLRTDDELELLRAMRKRVTNPGARRSDKPTGAPVHRQRSFKVRGEDDRESRFEVYQRRKYRPHIHRATAKMISSLESSADLGRKLLQRVA